MFDFKKEVVKFKPILEINDIEKSIRDNEVHDMMDLLKELNKKNKITDGEE